MSDINGLAMVRHPTKLFNMWLHSPALKPHFELLFNAIYHEVATGEQILSDDELIEHLADEIRLQMEKQIEGTTDKLFKRVEAYETGKGNEFNPAVLAGRLTKDTIAAARQFKKEDLGMDVSDEEASE